MEIQRFRVVFMGTPDFAVPSLNALLEGPDEVVGVVTQPDRPSGRGRKVAQSPVKKRALEVNVPIFQPERIKGDRAMIFCQELESLAPDIIVVAAFGQILPARVLALPKYGCINVHASLLPRWRGASPIQWAILAGDEKTGISIMQMDEGLDTGPVIFSEPISIDDEDDGGRLHDRLSELGGRSLIRALDLIRRGEIQPIEQDNEYSTYAGMLKRNDGRIDFSLAADEIQRRIRAFQPWPGAFTYLEDTNIKVMRASVERDSDLIQTCVEPTRVAVHGQIIKVDDWGILVFAGKDAIRIEELQPEGKKKMSAIAFAAGRGDLLGRIFS